MRMLYVWFVASVLGILYATLVNVAYFNRPPSSGNASCNSRRFAVDFVPRPFFGDCDDLFTGSARGNFAMSADYFALVGDFRKAVGQHREMEGHSGTKLKQVRESGNDN